jgi:copper chaperone CopZ
MSRFLNGFLLFVAAGLLACGQLQGQNPSAPLAYTVITVEKMHCDGCAKRIAAKVYEVKGVEKIQVDVEKKHLWVHPKAGTQPSPRGFWEAVEKASDRPTKLHGPTGFFTAKPQS